MKKLVSAVALMVALSPLAMAQDKGKAEDAKAAPPATAKKEPSEKQKAQRDRMKNCRKDADGKKMKGDERSHFMSECMKAPAKK